MDPPTATIQPHVNTPFVTTAHSSEWLPSPQSQSHQASHQKFNNSNNQSPQSQQDFVLYPPRRSFEAPVNARSTLNSPAHHALGYHRRHSSHSHLASTATLQNQRVAEIIQGTGHSTSSSSFNRFNPQQAQNFYALSAHQSTSALRQQRPRVPLFSQSTSSIPAQQADMFADMDLFGSDSTPAFGLSEGTAESPFGSTYSPAVPTYYDFEHSAEGSSNMGTVSPQDLMRDPIMSAPGSAAFTNLTTPSLYNESPDFGVHEYENSPLFGPASGEASGADAWYSLFPENDMSVSKTVESVDIDRLSDEDKKEVADALKEVNSSGRARSDTPGGRHSSSSGISRKRVKVLAPITVDPEDTVAMKRARNTMAARKSREKKMQKFDELEAEIEQLKKDRDHWKAIALSRAPTA